jgi:hypothetical protein
MYQNLEGLSRSGGRRLNVALFGQMAHGSTMSLRNLGDGGSLYLLSNLVAE